MRVENDPGSGSEMTKLCTDCVSFRWEQDRSGFPTVYAEGIPTCSHKDGWKGVDNESLGYPLRVDWARGEHASCGPDGRNWTEVNQ